MIERASLVSVLAFLCALPLTAACGAAQEPTPPSPEPVLRARLEFDTGESRATGLLSSDESGSGADLLVTLQRGPGVLRLYSGLSNRPGFTARVVEIAVGDYALGPVKVGAWKSLRGGGPALVAIAERADPALALVDLRKLLDGSPADPITRIELSSRPRALASGDLGGDGTPEVAVATLEDELLLVRGGVVAGRFALADAQTTCIHFTTDGRALLVGSQATRRITCYVPDAQAVLRATDSVELQGLPRRIDEVVGWRGSAGARYLVASGDRELVWLGEDLTIERTDELAAVPIDVTHAGPPGKRALLAASVHGQEARIEREDGPTTRFYAGQHPVAAALGDFDADGYLDAAFANSDAKRISVVFGRADGGFELAHFAKTGRSPHSIDAGDFDGDGRLDVVALCALDGTVRVHPGGPEGLGAGVAQGFAEGANRVRAHDLDRDGHLDVVFLRETARGVLLDAWFGDGTGRLWQRGETPPVVCARSPGDLLVLDLEADGSLEAIVTDPSASQVVVVPFEVSAGGVFTFGAPRAQDVAGSPQDLALAARATGSSLVAVTLAGEGPRRGWAILSASRTGLVESFHQPMPDRPRGIAVDLATSTLAWLGGGDAASTLVVFERGATPGSGLVQRTSQSGGLRAYAVRAADLDGDGRTDFAVSAQNSHHVNLWFARGASGALERAADVGVGTGPLDFLVADLDGDGRPELVVACAFSDEIAVVKVR